MKSGGLGLHRRAEEDSLVFLLFTKISICPCATKPEESLATMVFFFNLFLEQGWKKKMSMAASVWGEARSWALHPPWGLRAVGSGCWGPWGGSHRQGGCPKVGRVPQRRFGCWWWLCSWRALCLHDRGFMLQEKNVTRDRVRFGFLCFNCWRI